MTPRTPAPATPAPRRAWPRPALGLVLLPLPWVLAGALASLGWLSAAKVWWVAAALVLLALLDLLLLRRVATPTVARDAPEAWALGVEREVALRLQHAGPPLRVEVHDLHPGEWAVRDLPRMVVLRDGEETVLPYRLTPGARGPYVFTGTQLRLHSPMRLWRQSRTVGGDVPVRVFPNFAPLAGVAMFTAEQASRLVGAHVRRRRGEGTDFHQMREYRVGDSLRQIDWKATARARRLISREYQDEKNQQLMLVLDTGRRMLAQEQGLSHFDRALDAALLVSYIALKRGDAVGLATTGEAPRWVAPCRGMAALDTLIGASYDLQPAPVATDYLATATQLALRQRRRALVMLVTNLRDEDIDEVLAAVRVMQQRHLVVVASLREQELDEALDAPVEGVRDAARMGAVARYIAERTAAHDLLRSQRVMVLDVTCDQLPAALVEQYMAVKRSGLL